MMMPQVNRAIEDPMLDDIDHALGRPESAFGGYRNYYAADHRSPEAARMAASPYWEAFEADRSGPLVGFRVTAAGREALKAYLDSREPFAITKTAKRRAEAKRIIEDGAEHITAAEALARINAADKSVKPIKTPVTWGRWLKAGCPGLEE